VKFTVLLPTRNRLALLKYAVETVRRQNYANWEIIVSDNASEEDIEGFIASLADSRIKYLRTEQFVPVTANWNNALAHATGDYIVMLGDDDGLLRDYFQSARRLIETFSYPELVLTDALLYAYPGVVPGHADGFLQIGFGVFFSERTEPYMVSREVAREAVQNAMNFRISYQFNMQYSLMSHKLVERASRIGPFFQSPYPDYYASNANLLLADTVLAVPRPMACIGISRQSFGYYFFNQRQEEGARLLNDNRTDSAWQFVADKVLPGSQLYSSWLAAVEMVHRNFAGEHDLKVNYARYRMLQLVYLLQHGDSKSRTQVIAALRGLERAGYLALLGLTSLVRTVSSRGEKFLTRRLEHWISPLPNADTKVRTVPWQNMLDVYEGATPEYY
jgi:glycosyltransferase involved in cell wall biosynthesis